MERRRYHFRLVMIAVIFVIILVVIAAIRNVFDIAFHVTVKMKKFDDILLAVNDTTSRIVSFVLVATVTRMTTIVVNFSIIENACKSPVKATKKAWAAVVQGISEGGVAGCHGRVHESVERTVPAVQG